METLIIKLTILVWVPDGGDTHAAIFGPQWLRCGDLGVVVQISFQIAILSLGHLSQLVVIPPHRIITVVGECAC